MKPPDFTPAEIAAYYRARVPGLKQVGDKWRGPCPIHQGKDANFAVDSRSGMAYCHSQCGRGWGLLQLEQTLSGGSWQEARTAIDALVGRCETKPVQLREVATHDYTDENGELLYQVVRYQPKAFRQRRRVVDQSGNARWAYNVNGIRRVLYRLPKVLAADQVLLVEGEKDVEALEKLGFVATCNPGGACGNPSKWLSGYTEALAGKNVVILGDNDPPGQKDVGVKRDAILGAVRELRIVTVPLGKDASDWIAAGATRADIDQAIAAAAVIDRNNDGNLGNPPYGAGPNGQEPPPELPEIQVNNRQFRDICDDALAAIRALNSPPRIFVRATRLVTVERTELNRAFIAAVDDRKLRNLLSRVADYIKTTPRGCTEVPPPLNIAQDILARDPATWPFPRLQAIIDAPTLRPDGSILAAAGYDGATGLYLEPSPEMERLEIPDDPGRDDIDAALAKIDDAIGEFPFVDDASHANALAALLTPVCRHLINGPVPLALFDATTPGTGKTLLAEVIALIATGRPAELMGAPVDPEEWRKQLTSLLLEGHPLPVIDNVMGVIKSDQLAKVLTGDVHKDRILGKSESVLLPIRCSWIATGNNLRLGGDMHRRCYWIRMDARCPDPFRRTGFKYPRLKEYVLANRKDLLRALLILVRAWYAAGQPPTSTPPVGSFERWTELIGGILEYAGVKGFLENSETLFKQADVERSDWETFLEALDQVFAGVCFTIAELWEKLNERATADSYKHSPLSERAERLGAAIPAELTRYLDRESDFKQRVGIAFNQHRDQRFGTRQLRVEKAATDSHSKVSRWRISSND
jgi:hypothetical protein